MKKILALVKQNENALLKSKASSLSPEIFTVDTTLQLVKDVASLEKFGVKPIPSPSLAWFSFILNHTLPDINSRGRCWSYKTQKNSVASCKHNLIDLEHIMEDNGLGHTKNTVIGNMVDVFLQEIADVPSVPDEATPAIVLGVLYKRLPIVQRILSQIDKGRQYQISMECIRDASTDAVYHKGKFIPVSEDKEGLINSVGEIVDGDRVGLALGGEDGLVYYWGTAITLHPADKKADILSFCASKDGCCIEISTAENAGRGDGQGQGGPKQGDGGPSSQTCVCPSCGARAKHERNVPCTSTKCPKCGAKMTGANDQGGEKGVKKLKEIMEGDGLFVSEISFLEKEIEEKELSKLVEEFASGELLISEIAARWTRKFINDLPNGAFAVIEPDYSSGKTDNKNCRHLPYKGKDGKVDLAHLRNALARANQIIPVTDSIAADELRKKAKAKLSKIAKGYLKTAKEEEKASILDVFLSSMEKENGEEAIDVAEVKEILENVQEKLNGIDTALMSEIPLESPQEIGTVSLDVLDSLSRQINCPKCGQTYSSTIKSIDLVKNKMYLACSNCNTNFTLRYAVTSKGTKKSVGGETKMEISQEELNKKIKEAVDKATVDLKKEKDTAEAKLQEKESAAKLDERVKKMGEEKLEVSEARKEKIKKMAISEEGDKEFSSYLEDLKKAVAEGKEIASDNKNKDKSKNKDKNLPLGGGNAGDFAGAH